MASRHAKFLAVDEARGLDLAFEIFRGEVGPCRRQARIIHSVRSAVCRSRARPGIRRLRGARAWRTASSRRCRHAASSWRRSTKRCRNSAQVIEPAKPPDGALLMSATFESSQRIVGRPQRHAPQRIVLPLAHARDVCGQRLVIGVEGRQIRPERHPRRAGQRAEIDQQIRLLLVGQRQRIGQHQPALGVGVADLDRRAPCAT